MPQSACATRAHHFVVHSSHSPTNVRETRTRRYPASLAAASLAARSSAREPPSHNLRSIARSSSLEDDGSDIDEIGAPGDVSTTRPKARSAEARPTPTTSTTSPARRRRAAESTDAVATFMTRRFGLKGGLAWLALLTFGVVSEQMKTRRETREAKENTREVATSARRATTLANGITFVDVVIGGGEEVANQYLIAANVVVKETASGRVVFDTRAKGRQVVWSYGGRLGMAITKGAESGVKGMRMGGRRIIQVPGALAEGASFGDVVVASMTDLTYDVEITRVSVPPS